MLMEEPVLVMDSVCVWLTGQDLRVLCRLKLLITVIHHLVSIAGCAPSVQTLAMVITVTARAPDILVGNCTGTGYTGR